MHIFLTGGVQVGKSTIIRRWLQAHPQLRVGGFRTVPGAPGKDGEDTVHIIPAAGNAVLTTENRIMARQGKWPHRRRELFPQVFDSAGVALLRDSGETDILIMDEIGFTEDDALLFQRAVLEKLEGDVPVLGVVRSLPGVLADAVRAHPKSKIVEVTRENREGVLEWLLTQELWGRRGAEAEQTGNAGCAPEADSPCLLSCF